MKVATMKLPSIILTGLLALPLAACGDGGGGGGGGGSATSEPAAVFAACASCHSAEKDGPRRSGPNLFGVVGKTAGTQPGFAYSKAMKDSGITWTPETLDAFLASPHKLVPGNRMGLPGINDAAERKAMIDYLATLK